MELILIIAHVCFLSIFVMYTAKLSPFHPSPRHVATLDSDGVVTIESCRQHSDLAANISIVTVLPAINNNDYTVTV